jgi:hypothetical protein
MRIVSAACLSLLIAVPAQAGPAGDALRDALYAGKWDDAVTALQPLAAADDSEAAFGLGVVQLVRSVEGFAQALYRHGFAVDTGSGGFAVPLPPVLDNPAPEPLDYEGFRTILSNLVTGLDEAHGWLVAGGATGDWVIEIDPLQVRVDINGDGAAGEGETLAALMQSIGAGPGSAGGEVEAPFGIVGFDRADSYWFAGYTQIAATLPDFLLAHDFESFADSFLHRFFPRAGFPMQDYATGGRLMFDPGTDTALADVVAGIHTINWPVTDAARLAGVRERMARVLDLSRQNWAAIFDETDNNRELIPSPSQTGVRPDVAVTQAQADAWLETLDQAQRVLDGELLVPHWRFRQGFDLKAYFDGAERTDLVMLLTGYDAIPFLKDGPIASAEEFRAAQEAFGDDWLGYAFWFN